MIELKSIQDGIPLGDNVDHLYLPTFQHKEILLFHRPSATVFCADMIWNLPAREQYEHANLPEHEHKGILTSIADSLVHPDGTTHKLLTYVMSPKPSPDFTAQIHKLIHVWKPQVLVPEHGDVMTTDVLGHLETALSWAWKDDTPAAQ